MAVSGESRRAGRFCAVAPPKFRPLQRVLSSLFLLFVPHIFGGSMIRPTVWRVIDPQLTEQAMQIPALIIAAQALAEHPVMRVIVPFCDEIIPRLRIAPPPCFDALGRRHY